MLSKAISVFRERYCRRVVRDMPRDLEPDELDPLGVLRARVAPALAAQPALPRGTPAYRQAAHFNVPSSPPSSRPQSRDRQRSFHLGVNKTADRPARSFDRYATSKGAARDLADQSVDATRDVSDPEPDREIGAAVFDRYAASHGGVSAVPDHDTTLSRDPVLRPAQWDAVEAFERSLRVNQNAGPPRIAILYERAPVLFDAAAAGSRCPPGLRDVITKEQRRVARGGTLSKIHQSLGVEWIDDGAPAAQDWLASLPGWDPATAKDKRLSRMSQGRAVLTHISGEIEYPKELLADRAGRDTIRRGLLAWFGEFGREGDDDPTILPAAVYDHVPDRLNDRRNIHCHFSLGTRRATIGEDGALVFAEHKVDAITRMGFHERLREKFAELVNIELTRIAANYRLHPGTHPEMGIDTVVSNRKLAGRATVLERASVPTANGLFNDIENWSRRFDHAAERHRARKEQIAATDVREAARAMMLLAAALRYEAEEIGLLIGMSVSRAKRTVRFAPAYAETAKRERDRQGWTTRRDEADAYLQTLNRDLTDERRAIVERRREAARLDRAAAAQIESDRRQDIEAASVRAAAHRAVDTIARTPLLITGRDGTYAVERQDDPEALVAGIDLGAAGIQKRLHGQYAAQRKELAQVRSFLHKHGHAGLFDDAKIGRSAWLRASIERWRSSPILQREEAERSTRAAAHRTSLVARNDAMRALRIDAIDGLAADGLIELAAPDEPAVSPELVEAIETQPAPVTHAPQPPQVSTPPQAMPLPVTVHSEWPWRPGWERAIPVAVAERWRAADPTQFATDITAFEYVLSARPDTTRTPDRHMAAALGDRVEMLEAQQIHDRLTAVWLYQQQTRYDLLATCQTPQIISDLPPPFDRAIGRLEGEILADRERHAGDAVLAAMYDAADRGEQAIPKLPLRNRLFSATLAAIAAGERPAVCRLLADAALAQDGALHARRYGLLDAQDAAIWAASSKPGRGIFRTPPKRGRARQSSLPHHPGRR